MMVVSCLKVSDVLESVDNVLEHDEEVVVLDRTDRDVLWIN